MVKYRFCEDDRLSFSGSEKVTFELETSKKGEGKSRTEDEKKGRTVDPTPRRRYRYWCTPKRPPRTSRRYRTYKHMGVLRIQLYYWVFHYYYLPLRKPPLIQYHHLGSTTLITGIFSQVLQGVVKSVHSCVLLPQLIFGLSCESCLWIRRNQYLKGGRSLHSLLKDNKYQMGSTPQKNIVGLV